MEVNLDLMSFIETSILPRYTAFGRSHGLSHVQRVIANSLELVKYEPADKAIWDQAFDKYLKISE